MSFGFRDRMRKLRRSRTVIQSAVSYLILTSAAGNALAGGGYSLSGFVYNAGEDFKYVATSPSRMDRESGLITLGIIGTGAILYTQDEKIRDFVQNHQRSSSLDSLSNVAEKFGNGVYELPFLALYGGSGYFLDNEKMQDTAFLSLESFLVANTIGTAVKVGMGRARPYTEEGSKSLSPFSYDDAHTSFTSGHTTSAFSLASVFAEKYDNPSVDIAAYGLATAVALQRIYDDKHWASDVFAGAALGAVVGKSVVYLHRKNKNSAHLIPLYEISNKGYGVVVLKRF